jgi:hypothetical protein
VRDQHQRGVRLRVEIEQQRDDAFAGVRVEVAGGLVGEQHGRPRDERARDRHALLLAARELARIVAGAVLEPDARQRFQRRSRASRARELQRQHHVFERGQRGHQVEGLEHEAHAFGAQRARAVLVERRQVGAREGYASGSRRIEPGQQRQQRRFPAPEARRWQLIRPPRCPTRRRSRWSASLRDWYLFCEVFALSTLIQVHSGRH